MMRIACYDCLGWVFVCCFVLEFILVVVLVCFSLRLLILFGLLLVV